MLTPREILQTDFRQAFRGYNVKDVDAFVRRAVKAYESLSKENKALSEEIAALQDRLREDDLATQRRGKLMDAAQANAAEIEEAAEQQARTIIEEAKERAQETADRAGQLEAAAQWRVEALRREEKQLKDALRHLLESTLNLLDDFEESPEGHLEAAVAKEVIEEAPTDQDG